jgi:hypothetical protein
VTDTRSMRIRQVSALLHARLVAEQIVLAMIVAGLALIWLRIPDSGVLDVIVTCILGLLVLAVGAGGEAWLALRLTKNAVTRAKILRGALFFLATAIVWVFWDALFEHLSGKDELYAGYINSRFSHSLRNVFSYEHVLRWLGWGWWLVEMLGTALLVVSAFALTASKEPKKAIGVTLRSGVFWLVFLIVLVCGVPAIAALAQWSPGHGLAIELTSLIVRMLLVVLLSGVASCAVLCVLAAGVITSDGDYAAPAGTPAVSQERTAKIP